ncbi:TetR/AcrR family transcriptional regulator [Nonomuraea sp. NPDC050790]|uniref:TetR/AcrR family transcriptional regulator n=1 Tax=Nonomuraea sp. NPDC050790 TaxID=3364371 RepID=UPI0037A1422A
MRERADRILDAAAGLLVQLGYKKVTVEDIAQRAGIGKGTVYLHWSTKQQLFEAVFLREAVAYTDALRAALRAEPAVVRPHRLLSESYLLVMGNPVLRELFSGDARFPRGGLTDVVARGRELMAASNFYDVLIRHKLMRDDVPDLHYTLAATHAGFYLLDAYDPTAARDVQDRAEALAFVVRHAFEPPAEPGRPALETAAAELLTTIDQILPPYERWIYSENA